MVNDIDVREVAQCTCLRLRRITRRITQIYDGALEPAGLTVNQFGMLARLYGASLRSEILPIGTLADRLGMDPTTLNWSLKPLEKEGFIANASDPADKRVRAVLITDTGVEKLRRAVPYGARPRRGSTQRWHRYQRCLERLARIILRKNVNEPGWRGR